MVSIATGLRLFVVVSTGILHLVHCNPVDDQLIGGRIVNGKIIDITRAPYQVSLRTINGFTFCGGSIISTRHILTAAHCFDKHDPALVRVVYGVSTILELGSTVRIAGIIGPDTYTSANTGNDVAILKVESPIILSSSAQIIKLAANEPVQEGISLDVTGWGSKREDGPGSIELRMASLNLVKRGDCEYAYRNTGYVINHSMICAKSHYIDACQGDSGGPMVRTVNGERRQVGIVSWGIGCARPEYPGVYTNVAGLYDFINSAMLL